MPEISRFFGIIIAMYYKEHQPPHFHAKTGGRLACSLSRIYGSSRDICQNESSRWSSNGPLSTAMS